MAVTFEERIINLLYPGVPFEKLGDCQGGFILFFHTEGKGFESPQEQVTAVGVDEAAHGLVEVADGVDKLGSAEDGAGENVIVACEVLGGALDDEVHSELDGPLVYRGAEGTVDERQDFVFFGDFFYFDEVKNVEVGIGRGFGENEACVFLYGLFEYFVIAEGDNGAFDAELLEIEAAEFESFFVAVIRNDDVVAGAKQREDGGGDGAHSGREDDAVFSAFEVGQPSFRDLGGWVAIPAVLEMFHALFGVIFDGFAVLKRKGCGLDDWGGE